MKTDHLISLAMITLLVACQQSETPKVENRSNAASVAVEKVVQQKTASPEEVSRVEIEKSKPAIAVNEPISREETIAKESVAEAKEVLPVVVEVSDRVEVVAGKETSQPIESPKAVVEPAVVEAVSGNAIKGAKLSKGKCGACHYFDKDRKKVGPTLMGIYNRSPAIDGVPYPKWDAASLDAWLTNPKAVKPKTKMGFRGLSDRVKRDDIIAYLKTL